MKVEVSTDIEWGNNPLAVLGFKLQIIQDALRMDLTKITGYSNDLDMNLNFHSGSELIAHLHGDYTEQGDLFPATISIYGTGQFKFNWHPFGEMGGFDQEAFEAQFSEIFRK